MAIKENRFLIFFKNKFSYFFAYKVKCFNITSQSLKLGILQAVLKIRKYNIHLKIIFVEFTPLFNFL